MQLFNLMLTLPDDWGRALLAKKWNLPRAEQTVPNFLKFQGTNGLGALSFHPDKEGPYTDPSATLQLAQNAGLKVPNFLIQNPDRIIEDVYQSVVNWQDVFGQYEVPEDDIQRLEPGITQRLKRIEDPRKDLDHGMVLKV